MKLTSFAIGGGTITQETDVDGEGLKDYKELLVHNTNWQNVDTDHDSMPDGWEILFGLNSLLDDANEDDDNDGADNLLEYNRNTDPNNANSKPILRMPWIQLLLLQD